MYYIWRTDHPINQKVTESLIKGIPQAIVRNTALKDVYFRQPRKIPAIGYGILRGTGDVFKYNYENGEAFWEVDRGYIKPHHYSGYYRISYCGMQAEYNPYYEYPNDRLDALNVTISDSYHPKGHILVVPPSKYIADYYGVHDWLDDTKKELEGVNYRVRDKSTVKPLEEDLYDCAGVVTFNSNVAVEASMKRIPVNTSIYSVCHEWMNVDIGSMRFGLGETPRPTERDVADLLRFISYQQFTLQEIEDGLAWKILTST